MGGTSYKRCRSGHDGCSAAVAGGLQQRSVREHLENHVQRLGSEWCSWTTVHLLPILRSPTVKRTSSSALSPFASVPRQRIRAVANATSFPAEMLSSLRSKMPELLNQAKNSCHDFL